MIEDLGSAYKINIQTHRDKHVFFTHIGGLALMVFFFPSFGDVKVAYTHATHTHVIFSTQWNVHFFEALTHYFSYVGFFVCFFSFIFHLFCFLIFLCCMFFL